MGMRHVTEARAELPQARNMCAFAGQTNQVARDFR